ncbi:hypothetical protein HYS31_04160 [Candidatus Woesearchaeota archaeon]|nr:hypothetical protein [Candidatus Woesearchaeota archaeon]
MTITQADYLVKTPVQMSAKELAELLLTAYDKNQLSKVGFANSKMGESGKKCNMSLL